MKTKRGNSKSIKQKMGTYEHLSILIVGQDTWKEKDKQSVLYISLSERNKYVDYDFHFYHKLREKYY